MLLSLSLLLLLSLLLSTFFNKLRIPSLLAMIITGILLGPYVFNVISPDLISISSDLREIALIVILLRAGLSLDLKDLKQVGRPALLLSFLPATIEIIAIGLIAPLLFPISYVDSFLLGTIIAAVSPAVIVPRMIQLIDQKLGTNRKIPQMVLAGASIDDIYVIVLFSTFLIFAQTGSFQVKELLSLPIALFLGIFTAIYIGKGIVYFFKKFHMRDTIKVLILFSVSFLFVYAESALKNIVPFSGLIAILFLGIIILKDYPILAQRLTVKFSKIWVGAEIMLFVLIGALVDISVLPNIGVHAILLLTFSLAFRILAVQISLYKSSLIFKERLFVSFSYLPKATVQAAIGAIPLSMGLSSGHLILTIAVLSIFLTAPLGAVLMDQTKNKLLINE